MIEEICEFYQAARDQRETERKAGHDNSGTIGYETRGCYICDGHNRDCPMYFSLGDEE